MEKKVFEFLNGLKESEKNNISQIVKSIMKTFNTNEDEANDYFKKWKNVNERHMCIFEKRFCKFANKNGRVFDCTAPSDEAMTCR